MYESTIDCILACAITGLVFGAGAGSLGPQLGLFLVVTGSSSYLLQNGIIHWLSYRWLWPGRVMFQLAGKTERLRGLGRDFVERNTAKAIAIGAGLLWNYFGYKYFVFE